MRGVLLSALAPLAVVLSMLADTVPDVLGGSSGWAGAGLLGLVLLWLLGKNLPDKDRQSKEKDELIRVMIKEKDEKIDEMLVMFNGRLDTQRKEFSDTLRELTASFKQEAALEREACEKHFATLASSMATAFKTLGDQLSQHSLRNQQWLEVLRKELEKRGVKSPDEGSSP